MPAGSYRTCCVNDAAVLPAKFESPLYTAVIEWVPTASDEMVKVAVPEFTLNVPSVVLPSLKVIVPIGVPEPGANALTVAVKLMLWLRMEGVPEVLIAIDVVALLTVSLSTEDVLPRNMVSPP